MTRLHKDQTGFGVIEGLLVLVIIGVVGFVGWYVLRTGQKTDNTYSSAASTASDSVTQQSPQDATRAIMAALSSKNETQLNKYLTPAYKTFRQSNVTSSCPNGNDELRLFCGSLLDPATITKLTPTVTNYTFKDSTKGKDVEYKQPNSGEPGTNYYSFKLVANGKSWLLSDYGDLFDPSGTPLAMPIVGMRESAN